MIFRQITHDDLGCASYLIGDEHAGVAAVVDPQFDIEPYLALARYLGVAVEHVLETHNHADHVSGHGRLARATGARIHIHHLARAKYDHEPFEDGWELRLGCVIVRAVHTPGHRPEHTAFAVIDSRRGEEPWAVLSGDSLFIGDVARPDLAVEREQGAQEIFRSLHQRLLTLPAETEVWPGHLGGSLCGGPGMDLKISSTVGYERRHNPMLREADEAEFVHRSISALPPQPPNFHSIVELNQGPLVSDGAELLPLSPGQVQALRDDGAFVVDVRSDAVFDDAHVPGAVSIPAVKAGFGTRLAWLARGQSIVLIGRGEEDARQAAKLALAIGIRSFGGYLAGGMSSWREAGLPVQGVRRLEVAELPRRQKADPSLQVVDVRERSEHRRAHLTGSLLVPWHDLLSLPEGLDPGRPVAVICASGERAAVATGLLQRGGAHDVVHVVGGGVPDLV